MSKKIVLVTTVAALAGLAIYIATRKSRERRRHRDRDQYLANVFTYAKRNGGNEFVL